MMYSLPFLLSIPHGGLLVPPELEPYVEIPEEYIFEDMDPFSQEIYDLGKKAAIIVDTPYARAFIDMNRPPSEMPPAFPDGIVKSYTCYGRRIYKEDTLPSPEIVRLLLDKYYFPYHQKLAEGLQSGKIIMGFDCHTMAENPPPVAPDKKGKRPMINLGDNHGKACPTGITKKLARSLAEAFRIPLDDISINKPFAGGHITREHGKGPKPFVQIEMNRKLYLSEPWFDAESLMVDKDRLSELNGKFLKGLEIFRGCLGKQVI
jgi:formiminoglutamase